MNQERQPTVEPWPARQQAEKGWADYRLLEKARQERPMVAWWWNQRDTGHGFGAVCYCCGELVATWDRRYPMTAKAKAAVMEHREQELAKLDGG